MSIQLFNPPTQPIGAPVYLLHGQSNAESRGILTVYHKDLSTFPPQYYEINSGFFKALVHVNPGTNEIILRHDQGVLNSNAAPTLTKTGLATLELQIQYKPNPSPPVHLCILVGKDSPMLFDCPKSVKSYEGNGIDVAVKKLRMAGRIMQAFTQQDMIKQGLGPLCFPFAEEITTSTISRQEETYKVQRSEIKIHVIKSQKTIKELRDPNLAQQNSKGKNTGGLYGIAMDALKEYGSPFTDRGDFPVQAAVLFLDAHWDPQMKLILAHAALGGGDNEIKLAIFGSHGTFSWPKNFEELTDRFTDSTRTDTSQVANDANECGTHWECCTITMGAFMHEIGHLLGCPHRENGVMLRDYVKMNRTFLTKERFCARTHKGEWEPVSSRDECTWNRLDAVNFVYHRSFSLPESVTPASAFTKPLLVPSGSSGVMVNSDSGIYLVEFRVGEWSRNHLEFLPQRLGGPGPQKSVALDYNSIQRHLPFQGKKLDIEVVARGGTTNIADFAKFVSESSRPVDVKLCNGSPVKAFKSSLLGNPSGGQERPMVVFGGGTVTKVRVHHGSALDGVEVFYSQAPPIPARNYKHKLSTALGSLSIKEGDLESCIFGNRKPHYTDFDLHSGEEIKAFVVRCGAWIDGIQIELSSGRKSDMLGNASGGEPGQLIAPPGYKIVGFHGRVGGWCDALGILYSPV